MKHTEPPTHISQRKALQELKAVLFLNLTKLSDNYHIVELILL